MPSIQQTAALALGRLANYNEALAEAVVANDVLPQLVQSLSDQNVSSNLIICEMLNVSYSKPTASSIYSDFIKKPPLLFCVQ